MRCLACASRSGSTVPSSRRSRAAICGGRLSRSGVSPHRAARIAANRVSSRRCASSPQKRARNCAIRSGSICPSGPRRRASMGSGMPPRSGTSPSGVAQNLSRMACIRAGSKPGRSGLSPAVSRAPLPAPSPVGGPPRAPGGGPPCGRSGRLPIWPRMLRPKDSRSARACSNVTGRASSATRRPLASRVTRPGKAASIASVRAGKLRDTSSERLRT